MAGALATVLLIAHAGAAAFGADSLSPDERARRDAQRLAQARVENQQQSDRQRQRATRIARTRVQLGELQADIERRVALANELKLRTARTGQDVELVNAVARSAAMELAGRLRNGPLASDNPQRLQEALALADRSEDADALYRLWFALHEELAASAASVAFAAPVQLVDGVRETTPIVRFGAQLLVAGRRPVAGDGPDTLVQLNAPLTFAPEGRFVPDGAWRYRPPAAAASEPGMLRRQLFDGGWIAGMILACAGVGALAALLQASGLIGWTHRTRAGGHRHVQQLIASEREHLLDSERRDGSPRLVLEDRRLLPRVERRLGVLASAAMLLGLLGTVLGMIYTFRSLSLYGGGDSSVAAAGITHALSTTWLGLCVAIPLTLAQALLRGWRARIENRLQRDILAAVPAASKQWPADPRGAPEARPTPEPLKPASRPGAARRIAPSIFAGAVLAALLFVLMSQLLRAPAATPPPPMANATVTRVVLPSTPPPPPEPERVPTPTDIPATGARAAPLALPALPDSAPPTALPGLPETGLDLPAGPAGAGGGVALAGADTDWIASAGDAGFAGDDLIPIASARPVYPPDAAQARVEGWVELVFSIRASGEVANVRVLDAEPPGVFEVAAANAMRRWLYAPLYRDGKPVEREATQLIRFSLSDLQDHASAGPR